ncbi:MAG: phosphate/phosphite/phosphonate ABC transporter substrate-binding protein [Nitrosomonadales bacterium]|nr:phosphate/phosphite/phosphonate ABC transporter substrate-binding protein [Nitrosomonadales bacterium]
MVSCLRRWLWLLLLLAPLAQAAEKTPSPAAVRIGLTPVFLDDQAAFVSAWRIYLEARLHRPVTFVQRGSYRETVDMLREGKLDFAWVCGYPYVRNRDVFRLLAVPLYKGEPLYQSYIIVPAGDKQTRSISDLRGKVFAFSDPDSNSGHLYPEYLLAKRDETAAGFFSKTFYTWSHRKVVEAVASGLAQGGAVDGYVWDTLVFSHPELTNKTRVIAESPQFGHPPFVASRSVSPQLFDDMQKALVNMVHDPEGSPMLAILNLDGFVYGDPHLFDGIAEMFQFIEARRNAASQRH